MNETEQKLERMAELKAEMYNLTHELQKEYVLLEEAVTTEILVTGVIIETDYVKTVIRNPAPRNSWDNKGLMGYSVGNPDILRFCKTANVQPHVAITWK
jgi:hypothetical protein